MDKAVVRSNTPIAIPVPTDLGGRLQAMPTTSKLALGFGTLALLGIVLAMSMWGSHGDYKVLYANLSDKDGGAILAQLSQMNVPYRHADGGAAILVPASQVHDVRLKLASAGLPKGSVVGFELMESARFGQTQFQERLNFQRGLEGELTRSITALAAVQGARVHLALANQNGFFREQQKPSASVLLTLYPGRTLDRAQVAGIVHLVAASVAELSPKAVSVLDQSGSLLSGPSDDASTNGLDAQQLQYVAQVEQGYSKRIFELLEPVVGRDNLRATVTADIDFTRTESTSELFKPNQGNLAEQAVRSQQSAEQSGESVAPATGVPGATSNQPPSPATAPLTGATAPLQTAQVAGASGSSRRDSVVNFEIDKTVRVTRNATGSVKRLSAAVVVNNGSVTDARGKTSTVALTPEEVEKLTTLVRESVGFNKERGDSVTVINAPFKVEPVVTVETVWWKEPELIDLVRAAAVPSALALVALLLFFGLVRPALRAVQATPAPGDKLDAVVDEEVDLADTSEPPASESAKWSRQLAQARQLTNDNPAAVANIVSNWVSGEPA